VPGTRSTRRSGRPISSPRGESGALVVPLGALARRRGNPFLAVIAGRLDEAARLDTR